MRLSILSLLIILLICFGSCSNEEYSIDSDYPYEYYYSLEDGTIISGINLLSLEFGDYSENGFVSKEEYDKSIKTLTNYEILVLSIRIKFDNRGFHFIDKEKDKQLQSDLYSYLRTKGKVITDDSKEHSNNGDERGYGREEFLTAYINGGVELTCNEVLFGLQPGDNLISHMILIDNYTCQPIGLDSPYSIAHCEDIDESLVNSVFRDKAWVRFEYKMKFKDIPEEKYDELTFHLRFPFIKEYASHYISTYIKGYENQPRYEELVFEDDVMIRFK